MRRYTLSRIGNALAQQFVAFLAKVGKPLFVAAGVTD